MELSKLAVFLIAGLAMSFYPQLYYGGNLGESMIEFAFFLLGAGLSLLLFDTEE